jgi:cation transport ATPase
MDVLVVLGTSSAYFYGVLLLILRLCQNGDGVDMASLTESERVEMIHSHAHNFEISSSLITVILFGKLLETLSKKQTVDKLS